MSDLEFYRDKGVPLADRMQRAGVDNLESEELNRLLQDFAAGVRGFAKTARQLTRAFVSADKDDEFGFGAELAAARALAKGLALSKPWQPAAAFLPADAGWPQSWSNE